MKQIKFTLLGLVLLTANIVGAADINSAKGSLTVDGETTKLKYAYAEKYDGDITVIVTDNMVAREMIPDEIYNLGTQGKLRGIVFVVSGKDKKLLSGGLYKLINAVHFHPKWNQLGSVGNGALTISHLDGKTLRGKISTASENELAGHSFSYDISFSANIMQAPE